MSDAQDRLSSGGVARSTLETLRGPHLPGIAVALFMLTATIEGYAKDLSVVLLALWLVSGQVKATLVSLARNPFHRALLLYAGLLALGLAWSPDREFGLWVTRNAAFLLLVPVIQVLLPAAYRPVAISALIAGIAFNLAYAYLIGFGLIETAFNPASFPIPKRTYTVTSVWFGALALLCLYYAPEQLRARRGWLTGVLLCIAAVAVIEVFTSPGRGAQLAFLAGLAALAAMHYGKQSFKLAAVAVIGLLVVIVLVAYYGSPVFRDRLHETVASVEKIYDRANFDSSTGSRLLMWTAALEVAKDHPVLGAGTGSLRHSARQRFEGELSRFPLMEKHLESDRFHYHNQYLDVLVQVGVLGLAALINVLYQFLRSAYRRRHDLDLGVAFTAFLSVAFLTESTWRYKQIVFITVAVMALVAAPPRTPASSVSGSRPG